MDGPLLTLTATIWVYWLAVGALAVHQRVVHRRAAGIVPRERGERLMWWIWVPVIAGWIALPAVGLRKDEFPWCVPAFVVQSDLAHTVRWIAAAGAAACFLLTTWCWRRLGSSWSIAIVPGQAAPLVTRGPYRFARHPIYALSIAMMLCSLAVLPTVPMLLVATAHLVLMNLKARSEERHLRDVHGEAYRAYCDRVGRFGPRLGRA